MLILNLFFFLVEFNLRFEIWKLIGNSIHFKRLDGWDVVCFYVFSFLRLAGSGSRFRSFPLLLFMYCR